MKKRRGVTIKLAIAAIALGVLAAGAGAARADIVTVVGKATTAGFGFADPTALRAIYFPIPDSAANNDVLIDFTYSYTDGGMGRFASPGTFSVSLHDSSNTSFGTVVLTAFAGSDALHIGVFDNSTFDQGIGVCPAGVRAVGGYGGGFQARGLAGGDRLFETLVSLIDCNATRLPGDPATYLSSLSGWSDAEFGIGLTPVGDQTVFYTALASTITPLSVTVDRSPTAVAGADQSIHAGKTVTLDGSGSSDDNTPSTQLGYAWTLPSKPAGSTATLTTPDATKPWIVTLVADEPGTYVASLVVTDSVGQLSLPSTVTISSGNLPPVAEAGSDQGAIVGLVVTLDGSKSSDPNGDPITFAWTLAGPSPSTATLSGADTARPTFTPHPPGAHTAPLAVSDPWVASAPASVVITAITEQQLAENQAADALNTIAALPLTSVKTQGNKNALQNFITQALAALQAGDTTTAIAKLQAAISRTDGCALRGAPDGNGPGMDWITDCPDQAAIYPVLKSALDALLNP